MVPLSDIEMNVNESDDDTVEFEIEVVTSSSSVSLNSGDHHIDVPQGDPCRGETIETIPEQQVQEINCAHQQTESEPSQAENYVCMAREKLVHPQDYSHKLPLDTATNEAEDVGQPVDFTSEHGPNDECATEKPIENRQQQLDVRSNDQETIPPEAKEATIFNDGQPRNRSEAPNDASGADEFSELKYPNAVEVCNKVLSNDLTLEGVKSSRERGIRLDLTAGTFNVIGEQTNEQIDGTQCEIELDEKTFDGLILCERVRQSASLELLEEAVEEAPTQEADEYPSEPVTMKAAPIECRLVSDYNRCPDGWVLVVNPDELQILSLIKSANFTTSDAQPLKSPDADDICKSCDVTERAPDQTLSAQSSDFPFNSIDRQEALTVDQTGSASDIVLSSASAHVYGPTGDLVQQHSVDLTNSTGDALKAPHVIILNDAAEGLSDLDSAGRWPVSMDRQVCGQDDEYDSLDDRDDDDEEDLEREFDEEPEFKPRKVVVKQNRDPRDEYVLGSELGRGKFGTVVRCTEQASGRQLAAKFIAMRRREDREDVEREVTIMSVLQHKRLLQLYDAFDDGRQEMCLITELVEGGELFERIVDDDFELTEKKAAIFVRQICEGLEYMHGQQIVHLDMKPENVLCLSRTGNRIKLIDFGLARQLDPNNPIRVMFGTPDFAAPEVLGYETVTLNTDMWSVGVICYVLLSGLSPFMGENDMDTMANVTRATYDFNDQAFEPISDLAKDFISKLLLRNPTDRLNPTECLKHPWLQKGGSQLEAALRDRRSSTISLQLIGDKSEMTPPSVTGLQRHRPSFGGESTASSGLVSLDKRRLKRYVVKRKWHKTVHAIMALNRMGANLNKFTN